MPTNKQHHLDLSLLNEDFELGRMKPGSYSQASITKAMHPRQRRALRKLKREGTWNFANTHNLRDLNKWFDIFNDAFFGSLLLGCKLEFATLQELYDTHSSEVGGFCRTRIPGLESDPYYALESPKTTITVARESNAGPEKYIKSVLSTLLHEMSHAILYICRCYCEDCFAEGEREGADSYHWQRITWGIEQVINSSKQDGFWLGIDLQREVGMANDIVTWHRFPTEIEIRSLGLKPVIILRVIQLIREQNVKGHEWFTKEFEQTEVTLPTLAMGLLKALSNYPKQEQHNPAPLDATDFQLGRMKPLSYRAEDIAMAFIVSNSTLFPSPTGKLSTRQQRALNHFKSRGTHHIKYKRNFRDLKSHFEIFDDLYFGGLLGEYCKIELPTNGDLGRRGFYLENASSCEVRHPAMNRDPRFNSEKP